MQESEDKLGEALIEAEKACRKILEEAIGSKARVMSIVLKLEPRGDQKILTVDVEVTGGNPKDLGEYLEKALEEAFRVFEEKSGLKQVEGGAGILRGRTKTVSRGIL
ncbi:MAG: hypothetical protein P3X22_006435 [Thermoprotei archaeon]|nr:hypothetical protein [Thermoprotei archaeon]